MRKQSAIVIILIAFCLAISVGYALFSETITINGTATAKGSFDVAFQNSLVNSQVGSTEASITISEDKNTVTLNVPKLEYPGAYAEFKVDVINLGTIPAVLTGVTESGLTSDASIKVSYFGLTTDEVMVQGETRTVTIKVEWLSTSTQSSSNVNFSIKLNYEQITT